MNNETKALLIKYAAEYETADFINGDPSWFMHQVKGNLNQEAMAFVASCLSYGSRKQFMPKIESILNNTSGDIDEWIRKGFFETMFNADDKRCFYRLYNYADMNRFFRAYQQLLIYKGSLGQFIKTNSIDGFSAIDAICKYFSSKNVSVIVPKNTSSACKRVCMFLRWMVRDNSPIDIGLWSKFIDKRTLIMPLDTHVLSQSVRLGLLNNKTASMNIAIKLTDILRDVFPDDPLKGDFALFGYGVNNV